ncbi:hypothetical protein H2204_010282 [Knufia peltigerae]|uniref:ABM domain-containing protein n=1 Tax=Knufia peltigerae TaxID=1002370 RepID=A0AA38XXR5_9EURO|nr:hypothetical protein H2204_010282 [Knufia peltigerae]
MAEPTEIVHLKLKSSSKLEDPSSHASGLFKQALEILPKQKGFKQCLNGPRIEDPASFVMVIDWTSVDAHKQFINSEDYMPFKDRQTALTMLHAQQVALLAQIFDFEAARPPFAYHVNFASAEALNAARSAPVTEVAAFSILADTPASSSAKSSLEDAFGKIAQYCEANGAKGVAVGWTIEKFENPEGKMVNSLQVMVGWNSVEHHKEVTQLYLSSRSTTKSIKELTVPGKDGMGLFHLKFRQ